MKKSIFIVLVYFALQVLAAFVVKGGVALYQFIYKGVIVANLSLAEIILSLILSMLFMVIFLRWRKLIPATKEEWSIPSPTIPYLVLLLLSTLSSVFLLDCFMYYLDFLPDLNKQTFDVILTSFWGIIAVTLIGPLVEELVFRGAITQFLLEKYHAKTAIVISGAIFGLVHMNPVQAVGGFLFGLLLAWVYYKTKSILPVLFIHIINNSLSVILGEQYAHADTLRDLFTPSFYWMLVILSVLLLVTSLILLNKFTTSPFPIKKEKDTSLR